MTITPDQADRMKQAATSVPWSVHIDSNDVDEIYIYSDDGNMCIGIDLRGSYFTSHDLNLAAAAPDMAETIAGMEWEWAVQHQEGETWHYVHSWRKSLSEAEWDLRKNKGWSPDSTFRLVRRLASSPEVVEGEQ